MAETRWAAVDAFIGERLLPPDPVLDAALAANAAAGLPAIDVSPAHARLLQILARIAGARRILEIGTLGGFSTIHLARALPAGGRLVTLEAVPKHAEVARANLDRAGLADRVEVIVGPALATLPGLDGPFDFIFIDADKEFEPGLPRGGPAPRPPRHRHRLRQRRPRRPRRRPLRGQPGGGRHPPLLRAGRRRAAADRHRRPDRRRQGLGRLRHRHRRRLRAPAGCEGVNVRATGVV